MALRWPLVLHWVDGSVADGRLIKSDKLIKIHIDCHGVRFIC